MALHACWDCCFRDVLLLAAVLCNIDECTCASNLGYSSMQHADIMCTCLVCAGVVSLTMALFAAPGCRGLWDLHKLHRDRALQWFQKRREQDGVAPSRHSRTSRERIFASGGEASKCMPTSCVSQPIIDSMLV